MAVRKNWGPRKSVPKATTLPPQLEEELKDVRAVAPPPPSDNPIYEYLKRVYQLWHKLERSAEWQKAVQKYHIAHRLRIEKHYIRFIIQTTAGDHVTYNMKNKYKFIMDLAFEEGIKPVDVITFIKKHGGINKCVELWKSKYGRRRKKGRKKKP